jgi:cardiolipin synthase
MINLKSLPNFLTSFRMVLIPVICASFYLEDKKLANITGTIAFLIASATDYFDGYFARKYKIHTKFGVVFDPIADKLLVSSTLIMLSYFQNVNPIAAIIIIGREIFISGIREISSKEQIYIPVSFASKTKTAIQMFAIIFLIIGDEGSGLEFIDQLGTILIWIAATLTLYTGYKHYISIKDIS